MHSKVTGRSLLFSVFRNKPALDTQELRGEVNTAILSILGLSQGYNERRSISNVKDEAIGKSSLVTAPIHAKETMKLLHLRRQPKEDNVLADD